MLSSGKSRKFKGRTNDNKDKNSPGVYEIKIDQKKAKK